jgi:REP element-mobilizing transposase RayT
MLFLDALDREVFLDVLMIAIARAGWICHSYCILGTHYHLLIETPEPNIGAGMKRLNWLYAWRFNKRHASRGHAFESRYGAKVILSTAHALNTIRYIALNPVEAGLCSSPIAWPWSSYPATLGEADVPEFLTTDWVLRLFDERPAVARKELRNFVERPELAAAA